jgi:hypothetical protein
MPSSSPSTQDRTEVSFLYLVKLPSRHAWATWELDLEIGTVRVLGNLAIQLEMPLT